MTGINQTADLTMLPGTKTKSIFKCPHCPAQFTVKTSLSNHLRTQSGEKRHRTTDGPQGNFECIHCERKFKTNGLLLRHICHNSVKKLLPCPHCPAVFRQLYALKHHLRKHTNGEPLSSEVQSVERKYLCSHCSISFKTEDCYNHHLKVDHSGMEKPLAVKSDQGPDRTYKGRAGQRKTPKLACLRCPEKFGSNSDLMNHLNVHAVERKDENQSIAAPGESIDSAPPTGFTQNPNLEECSDLYLNELPHLQNHSGVKLDERNASPESPTKPDQSYTYIVLEIRSRKRQHSQNHSVVDSGKRNNASPESPAELNHSSHLRDHSDTHSSEQLLLRNHSTLEPDERNASLESPAASEENLNTCVVMETRLPKHSIVGSDRRMDLQNSLSAESDGKNYGSSDSSVSSSCSIESRGHSDVHLNEHSYLQDHSIVESDKKIHADRESPMKPDGSVNLRDHSNINSNERQHLQNHSTLESDKKNYAHQEILAEPKRNPDLRGYSDMHTNEQLFLQNNSIDEQDKRNYASSEFHATCNRTLDVRENLEAHAVTETYLQKQSIAESDRKNDACLEIPDEFECDFDLWEHVDIISVDRMDLESD